jgi:(p)ppGpp synthase/HD superfamily hydrolase
MYFTPRIDHALQTAANLHSNHTRRDKNRTPYVTHLVATMLIASEVTDDEDTLIACLMHDSVEDVVGFEQVDLEKLYGERVANIVYHVTEQNAKEGGALPIPSWITRKENYLKLLQEGPIESHIVSVSDKLHNLSNFMEMYRNEGESMLERFHGSIPNMIWYTEEVITIASKTLGNDNLLIQKLVTQLENAKTLFKEHILHA